MTNAEHEAGAPGRAPQDVRALVRRWVTVRPDATAVRAVAEDRTLTYAELWQAAGGLADRLAAAGVGPGDLVAVDLDRSAALVVALLGIVRAGAAYLPLDVKTPAGRVHSMLAASEARVLIRPPRPSGPPAAPDTTAEAERIPAGVTVLGLSGHEAASGAGRPEAPLGPEDPVYVAYTSGSTGTPKGVVVPHRAVVSLATEPEYCVIAAGDRVAQLANPAFDATTFEVWSALGAGATVVVLPSPAESGVEAWTRMVRDERITTMFLTTALFHMVAREQPDGLRTVRDLLVGGEHMNAELARGFVGANPDVRLANVYGPTETTTFAAWFDLTAETLAGAERVPVGRPLRQVKFRVLDADGTPTAHGGIGELYIGGAQVATGYLGRPDLTAERFVPLPMDGGGNEIHYRTGDLARELDGGVLDLLGRSDRQVKLRGFRIELEEIENAAVRTGLVDAAFVEKVGEGGAERLVAFVLPGPGGARSADLAAEIAGSLAHTLPGYMVPSGWQLLDRVPLGATGKADRAAMLALLTDAGTARDAAGETEPNADVEAAVVLAVLSDLLPDAAPRLIDDFFALGGNSILAVQAASRLGKELDLDVDPADVLMAATLADIAAALRDQRSPRI